VIAAIFEETKKSIQNSSLLVDFRMDHLPSLLNKFDQLSELLVITKLELSIIYLLFLGESISCLFWSTSYLFIVSL
jgi:hypothetical protein